MIRGREKTANSMSMPLYRRALRQTCVLAAVSVLVALLVNELRTDGLALLAPYSPAQETVSLAGQDLTISLEEAERLFFSKTGVFIDARSRDYYEEGHIKGALSLPWEGLENFSTEALTGIPKDAIIITYCDGEGCSLSQELALELFFRGYANVRVLENGWTVWLDNALPFETGPPITFAPSTASDFSKGNTG